MQDFKRLNVWQRARRLALNIYSTTSSFPNDEKYGIVSQLQRASVSIMTNIAEGSGRLTDKDFARFIQIAIGSSCEFESLLIMSNDLSYLDRGASQHLIQDVDEIRRMLISLNKRLK